jgi:hypothetical protein
MPAQLRLFAVIHPKVDEEVDLAYRRDLQARELGELAEQ